MDALADHVEHLCLDGRVEAGGWFVRDQQLGAADQRRADRDPLCHTPAELVRIVVGAMLGVCDPERREHLDRALPRLPTRHTRVHAADKGDLVANRDERI